MEDKDKIITVHLKRKIVIHRGSNFPTMFELQVCSTFSEHWVALYVTFDEKDLIFFIQEILQIIYEDIPQENCKISHDH